MFCNPMQASGMVVKGMIQVGDSYMVQIHICDTGCLGYMSTSAKYISYIFLHFYFFHFYVSFFFFNLLQILKFCCHSYYDMALFPITVIFTISSNFRIPLSVFTHFL